MEVSVLMFILMMQSPNGDKMYKKPFMESIQASYNRSELETLVNDGREKLKQDYPTPMAVGGVGYVAYIDRKIHLRSSRLSPFSNSTLAIDANGKRSTIGISWHF